MSTGLVPLSEEKYYEEANTAIGLMLQGYDAKEIAEEMHISRVKAKGYIDKFREEASHLDAVNDRAYQLLAEMDIYFGKLIKESNDLIAEFDQAILDQGAKSTLLQGKMSAIKLKGDLKRQQYEAMQKAGMLEGIDLGNQIVDQQEQMDKVIEFIKSIMTEYPHTKSFIANGLRRLRGEAEEVIVVNPDE